MSSLVPLASGSASRIKESNHYGTASKYINDTQVNYSSSLVKFREDFNTFIYQSF